MDTAGQVITGAVGLVGAALGFAANWLAGISAANREREARAEARRVAKDDFQLETLLTLQEEVSRFIRHTGSQWVTNRSAIEKTGTLAPAKTEDSEVDFQTRVRIKHLTARIRDKELTRLINEATATATHISLPVNLSGPGLLTLGELDSMVRDFMRQVEAINVRMSATLEEFI